MAIKVSGVKIGELEVTIEGGEGATLKQVLDAVGVKQDGMQFVINGDRKAPVTGTTGVRLRDGDTVEVFDRPEAGEPEETTQETPAQATEAEGHDADPDTDPVVEN